MFMETVSVRYQQLNIRQLKFNVVVQKKNIDDKRTARPKVVTTPETVDKIDNDWLSAK